MALPKIENIPNEVGGNPRSRPHEKIDADEYADIFEFTTDETETN